MTHGDSGRAARSDGGVNACLSSCCRREAIEAEKGIYSTGRPAGSSLVDELSCHYSPTDYHSEPRLAMPQCRQCHDFFTDRDDWTDHMRDDHGEELDWCGDCQKRFVDENALQQVRYSLF